MQVLFVVLRNRGPALVVRLRNDRGGPCEEHAGQRSGEPPPSNPRRTTSRTSARTQALNGVHENATYLANGILSVESIGDTPCCFGDGRIEKGPLGRRSHRWAGQIAPIDDDSDPKFGGAACHSGLISTRRYEHHGDPVDQTSHDRAVACVRDEEPAVLAHSVMGHEILDAHVRPLPTQLAGAPGAVTSTGRPWYCRASIACSTMSVSPCDSVLIETNAHESPSRSNRSSPTSRVVGASGPT